MYFFKALNKHDYLCTALYIEKSTSKTISFQNIILNEMAFGINLNITMHINVYLINITWTMDLTKALYNCYCCKTQNVTEIYERSGKWIWKIATSLHMLSFFKCKSIRMYYTLSCNICILISILAGFPCPLFVSMNSNCHFY